MKILMVHNFYQSSSPSGEDVVFRNEVELLSRNGIDVITYTRHNDEILNFNIINKGLLPFNNIWSNRTYREIKALIKREKPDIAHFHNIWYLISPSAYYACKDAGIPVIQTLHNFRISCVNGLLSRDGHVCEECISSKKSYSLLVNSYWIKLLINAIKYGCYRDSRIYSLSIALMQFFHWMKKTWIDKVDAYIALTEFGRQKFIEIGLPAEKIFVKPNFLSNPPAPNYSHKNYAVFLGRLSAEKGVNILIEAFKLLGKKDQESVGDHQRPIKSDEQLTMNNELSAITHNLSPMTCNLFHLKIIGDGPLMESLQKTVKVGKIKNMEFTGRLNFKDAMKILQNSNFMIMPALWYEGFPMTIREAFACGKPVIASNLGAMAELVEHGRTGLLFEPGNPIDLAEKIKWMIEHEDECIQMGKNARKIFEEKYTAERNYQILMEIYKKVIGDR